MPNTIDVLCALLLHSTQWVQGWSVWRADPAWEVKPQEMNHPQREQPASGHGARGLFHVELGWLESGLTLQDVFYKAPWKSKAL